MLLVELVCYCCQLYQLIQFGFESGFEYVSLILVADVVSGCECKNIHAGGLMLTSLDPLADLIGDFLKRREALPDKALLE